jgi:hypothetical protein
MEQSREDFVKGCTVDTLMALSSGMKYQRALELLEKYEALEDYDVCEGVFNGLDLYLNSGSQYCRVVNRYLIF